MFISNCWQKKFKIAEIYIESKTAIFFTSDYVAKTGFVKQIARLKRFRSFSFNIILVRDIGMFLVIVTSNQYVFRDWITIYSSPFYPHHVIFILNKTLVMFHISIQTIHGFSARVGFIVLNEQSFLIGEIAAPKESLSYIAAASPILYRYAALYLRLFHKRQLAAIKSSHIFFISLFRLYLDEILPSALKFNLSSP